MTDTTLVRDLERTGQDHIVQHLSKLEPSARARLERQLAEFDYDLVARLADIAGQDGPERSVSDFEPAPVLPLSRPPESVRAARQIGAEAIGAGTVAAFVVAGGQGSRLGYDGPKGCYRIGPISGKSLFQVHAEKTLAAARRHGAAIPFYVMTSRTNDAAIRSFFEQNDHFGLGGENVLLCPQRVLPAFDKAGRFILAAPDRVFVSPDGHGGAYHALLAGGALDDMARRGIEHISYVQVDNPLVPTIDPLFIGEHIRAESDMSSKVLEKREPMEKLGVFGYVDGELQVIEYSDMSDDLKRARRHDGSLKYRYGSIAVHVIDRQFARRMAEVDLPFHVARKRIPYVNTEGERIEPEEPNGRKVERFVFDAIPLARNPVVMEVSRADEFAPVKNAEGDDSPATCRAALMARDRRRLARAGIVAPDDVAVEISPLFDLNADTLAEAGLSDLSGRDRIYLE